MSPCPRLVLWFSFNTGMNAGSPEPTVLGQVTAHTAGLASWRAGQNPLQDTGLIAALWKGTCKCAGQFSELYWLKESASSVLCPKSTMLD